MATARAALASHSLAARGGASEARASVACNALAARAAKRAAAAAFAQSQEAVAEWELASPTERASLPRPQQPKWSGGKARRLSSGARHMYSYEDF